MAIDYTIPQRDAGVQAGAATVIVGPYSAMLPEPMRLCLGLRPSGGGGPLGWGARVESADVELGYNYIGLEERIMLGGVGWTEALALVEGLCGSCSQANTLAFVQAIEAMTGAAVPPRAASIRLVLAEAERITSHLLNAAGTLSALGMRDHEAVLRDLRERILQAISGFAGTRMQPGMVVPGGVLRDPEDTIVRALNVAVHSVQRTLRTHARDIVGNREVAGRLSGLGKISAPEATFAGLRGPVARASGITTDLRSGVLAGAYEDEGVTIVVQRTGDAFARLVVRLLECLESCRVIEQALDDLPAGAIRARGNFGASLGAIGDSAIGRVEGARGEVLCWIAGNAEGITGLHLSGGSFPVLGVLPGLLRGADLDDIPLLLLSLDLCLGCAER